MVIIFEDKKARKQLLEEGIVYTVRANKRSKTGIDWMTDGSPWHGHSKIADVDIKYLGDLHPLFGDIKKKFLLVSLRSYCNQSGFNSVEEWVDKIIEFCDGQLPSKLHLYRVSLEEKEDFLLESGVE